MKPRKKSTQRPTGRRYKSVPNLLSGEGASKAFVAAVERRIANGDEEANQNRIIAAEIVTRLFHAGQIDQLRMLEIQVKRAVEMMREAGVKPSF